MRGYVGGGGGASISCLYQLPLSAASMPPPPLPTSPILNIYSCAYVSIHQHTSAYASIRQHTSAYVSIRQHTSAYVSSAPIPHTQYTHTWMYIYYEYINIEVGYWSVCRSDDKGVSRSGGVRRGG
jgi:hypothetical protein